MADLDLDIVTNKPRTIRLFEKNVPFKNITVEEDFQSELLLNKVKTFEVSNVDDAKTLNELKAEYLESILELTHEEALKITLPQFKKLQTYMERLDFYDQGFTDKEIDLIEKKRLLHEAKSLK